MTDPTKQSLQALSLGTALLGLMLTADVSSDVATLLRIRAAQEAGTPTLHHAQGVIDAYHVDRGRVPVFRLSSAGAEPLLLTCTARARVDHYPCPPDSADWNARTVDVDWIDIATGLSGQVVHRATRIATKADLVFAAEARDVQAAETASAVFSIKLECGILLPMMFIFWGMSRLVRRNRGALEARIEAARQHSRAGRLGEKADARRPDRDL